MWKTTLRPVKETNAKQPRGIVFARLWLIFFACVLVIYGFVSFPYPARPWTDSATNFLLSVWMLYLLRMITHRNMIGALSVAIPLFGITWCLISLAAAVGLVAIPLASLGLPTCVGWMKTNSRLSVGRLCLMALMAFVGYVFYITPSLNNDLVSNMSPIYWFELGHKPFHRFDAERRHYYAWWNHGCNIGTCRVQYDENFTCSSLFVDMFACGRNREEDYAAFVSSVKHDCECQYGGEIKWSNPEVVHGLPVVQGRLRDDVSIWITPSDDADILGSALICSPRLFHDQSRCN